MKNQIIKPQIANAVKFHDCSLISADLLHSVKELEQRAKKCKLNK